MTSKMTRRPGPKSKSMKMLLLTALLAHGCNDQPTDIGSASPVSVSVVPAEQFRREPTSIVAGVVRPERRALIGTRQTGTVDTVRIEAGDHVPAGEELLRIDARDLEAGRHAAQQQREAAAATLRQAEQDRERLERLHEQELVEKHQLEQARVQEDSARGALGEAEAELTALDVNLDYAVIRAPFAGTVSELIAEAGSFVGPGPPLLILEDRRTLRIDAGIDQGSASRLRAGEPLAVTAAGVETFEARILAILPAVATDATAAVGLRLRLIVDTPPPGLLPGMVAEVQVPSRRPPREAVRVPRRSLLRRGQLEGVFVVEPDASGVLRAQLRWIGTEASPADDGAWIRVTRGLRAGEQVVVGDPVDSLVDSQPVTLPNRSPD